MSTFEALRHLDRAIRSILDQTFTDYEFLIIDDGSEDGTAERLREWAKHDSRIRLVLHEDNAGLGRRLAEGVERAHGNWIARMDADDVAMPYRLETQLTFVRENPEVDVVGSWAMDIDHQGRPVQLRRYPTDHETIARLIWTCPMIHPTVMFRTDAVRAVGSYANLRQRQDYDLWFRCLAGGLTFANIPTPLLLYRFTDDYYRRNDLSTAWLQARIGWRGCWRVQAPFHAYLGVAAPVLRCLFPERLNRWIHKAFMRVDPRRARTDSQTSFKRR